MQIEGREEMHQTTEIDIQSPCIGVCRLNAQQICVGCGRNAREIADWVLANKAYRLLIRHRAAERLRQGGKDAG